MERSTRERREAIRLGMFGQRHPDPQVAAVADEWATSVLQVPLSRSVVRLVVYAALMLAVLRALPLSQSFQQQIFIAGYGIFAGWTSWLFQRHVARRILRLPGATAEGPSGGRT
ncbi:MAG: hypothetical protein M0Z87_01930 [Actinomycetota bacterium]|nr:hypothetical protein [Actinomycetota bacterium]